MFVSLLCIDQIHQLGLGQDLTDPSYWPRRPMKEPIAQAAAEAASPPGCHFLIFILFFFIFFYFFIFFLGPRNRKMHFKKNSDFGWGQI
jgi:hypothetical protein